MGTRRNRPNIKEPSVPTNLSKHDGFSPGATTRWRRVATASALLILLAASTTMPIASAAPEDEGRKNGGLAIRVSFGADPCKTPLDGRGLGMLSTDPKAEPRMQIIDGLRTQQVFGIDVDGLQ